MVSLRVIPGERVAITARDGLRLEGWYVPSRNGAAVIVYPGRSGPQAQAIAGKRVAMKTVVGLWIDRCEAVIAYIRSAAAPLSSSAGEVTIRYSSPQPACSP